MTRHLPTIIVPLFLIAGLGIFGYGLYELYQSHAAKNWPTAEATILTSEVSEESDSDGTSYRPRITYEFTVDDTTHIGDRIHFGSVGSRNYDTHAEITARYPVAAKVPVHHHPSSPEHSVLEPGFHANLLFKPGFGAVFAILGGIATHSIIRSST